MTQPPEEHFPARDDQAGPQFAPDQAANLPSDPAPLDVAHFDAAPLGAAPADAAPADDQAWPAPSHPTQPLARATTYPAPGDAGQPAPDARPNFANPDEVQPPAPIQQSAEPTEQQWQQWAKPVTEADEAKQETELGKLAEQYAGSDPFEPAGVEFTPVSEELIKLRYWSALIWLVVMLIALGLPMFIIQLNEPFSPWWWALCLIPLAIFGWLMWLIPRQVRAMGYAETDSEFIVRKGIMWRTLVAVPYGRLQYVDINAGPLQRMLGLTTIQLHTASASTDANLPGLPPPEAARLRDRLSEAGESQLAGL